MDWHNWMNHARNIHMTATEWAQIVGDSAGISITTLWLVGLHHFVDGALHTVIACATLASISFSLYTKVAKHLKEKDNEQDS
jgi:hypothetical protein